MFGVSWGWEVTWGRMDDKFYRNPKVRALHRSREGRAALETWAFWWSWCLDAHEPDGEIDQSDLDSHERRLAALLVEAGLWERTGVGFRFVSFWRLLATYRTSIDRGAILERDRWTCVYCGADLRQVEPHIDHVIPLSRGGQNEPDNLAAACKPCNLSKGTKTPQEWRG